MLRDKISTAITEAIAATGLDPIAFSVERPSLMEHGDFSTNVALIAAKKLQNPAPELAQTLTVSLKEKLPEIEKIEVAGPGFINFYVSSDAIAKEVAEAAKNDGWARNTLNEGMAVMVEYTDPNPFKQFHIGHLMSNTIGEAIAKILEYSGARVFRANYQSDIGLHIAMAIWGYRHLSESLDPQPEIARWGDAYALGSAQYESNETAKLEMHTLNKELYEHAKDIPEYVEGRAVSLAHFEELYQILGTKFDFYFFETETGPIGLRIVDSHRDIFIESDGAIIFRGEDYGLHTRVFINQMGLPTYEAKELGLMRLKEERASFDRSIVITASEVREYFQVLLKAGELIFPDTAHKITHKTHGFMRLSTGKMSSRTGSVVTGESLILDLQSAAKEKMGDRDVQDKEHIAQEVAVGAIKYTILKQTSGKDIIFDPETSLSIEGDSGPYLQYAHTRALSLVHTATVAGIAPKIAPKPSSRHTVERVLLHFPYVLERSVQDLEPHYVTTYLTELASAFNGWYASERVIGGTNPEYNLLIAMAVERALFYGLTVLGIPIPKEM